MKNKTMENETMSYLERGKIVSICQTIMMDVNSLYGLIKCNPEMAIYTKGIYDLAEGLITAAREAATVADGLDEKELYHDIIYSRAQLIELIKEI